MKHLASILIGLSSLSFGFFTIAEYDAMTHVNARILNGTIAKDVHKQYLTIRDGVEIMDQDGYDASMNVLLSKYAPACLAAGCATK